MSPPATLQDTRRSTVGNVNWPDWTSISLVDSVEPIDPVFEGHNFSEQGLLDVLEIVHQKLWNSQEKYLSRMFGVSQVQIPDIAELPDQ
jgi:hypothetical protein